MCIVYYVCMALPDVGMLPEPSLFVNPPCTQSMTTPESIHADVSLVS